MDNDLTGVNNEDDRRLNKRVKISGVTGQVRRGGVLFGKYYDAIIINVSRGGAALSVKPDLHCVEGDRCTLLLRVPGHFPVEAVGEICYRGRVGGSVRLGLKFIRTTSDFLAIISAAEKRYAHADTFT